MRIGFSIIYNGLHHLKHRNFARFMADNFDYWIVVEGLALPGGSTGWCNYLDLPARSDDGTHEFMTAFSKQYPHVIYCSPDTAWTSKDNMVNEAVKIAKLITDQCYLWQVDADEIWTAEDLHDAEAALTESGKTVAAFHFNQMLCKTFDGRQLIGCGEWGGGYNTRLWKWHGEKFVSHEPPVLQGQSDVLHLPQRYDHYSYFFEQDVVFKSKYYSGHQYVYRNWKMLQTYTGTLPLPFTSLFGPSRKFNRKASYIDELKLTKSCLNQNAAPGLA